MFPLYDSIKFRKFPIINISLIVINILVFIQELLAPNPNVFISQYALTPAHVNFSNPITLLPFLTAMFLHGGWLHILSNMWFLWIFGDNVEGELGSLPYLGLYVISGLVGNFLQFLFMPGSTIPMLGASGAIAGSLGAYFILFPKARVKTLVFIFIFVTLIDIPAFIMLGYWFVLQIISGAETIGNAASGGVAFWAHIAGFMTGLLLAKILPKKDYPIEGQVVYS